MYLTILLEKYAIYDPNWILIAKNNIFVRIFVYFSTYFVNNYFVKYISLVKFFH